MQDAVAANVTAGRCLIQEASHFDAPSRFVVFKRTDRTSPILSTCSCRFIGDEKKADVAEHPLVQNHVGLLVNRPPGMAGLPFI
jgi:hypothetical protein